MKRGAEAVLSFLNDKSQSLGDDVVVIVGRIIDVVENTMDGTSGAIYAIFLNALAHGLRAHASNQGKSATPVTAQIWADALKYAVSALTKYTPAQIGDRTLVDALAPFSTKLSETNDVQQAAKAAQDGSEATKSMHASLGRAVYVGGEQEWLGKIPDPGAFGLSEFLAGLAEGLQ